MKKFLVFIALFCALGVFLNSCDRDKPTEPQMAQDGAGNWFNIASATAWYCSTDAHFDTAVANWSAGDTAYLVYDDVTYSVNSNVDLNGSIIGLDAGRSTFDMERRTIKFGDGAVENLYLFCSWDSWILIINQTAVSFTNCRATPNGGGIAYISQGDAEFYDCEIFQFDGQAAADVHLYDHDFIYYDNKCTTDSYQNWTSPTKAIEPEFATYYGAAYYHSWEYDDWTYSFDAFDFTSGGAAYWIIGDSLVVTVAVENFDCTGTLEYGDNDCTTYTAPMQAFNIGTPPETEYGWTVFYVKVDISWATGSPRTVSWNVEAMLCDEEINSGCVVKTKPRGYDDDPPVPEEE